MAALGGGLAGGRKSIPGFYYDEGRNRYFRLRPGDKLPKLAQRQNDVRTKEKSAAKADGSSRTCNLHRYFLQREYNGLISGNRRLRHGCHRVFKLCVPVIPTVCIKHSLCLCFTQCATITLHRSPPHVHIFTHTEGHSCVSFNSHTSLDLWRFARMRWRGIPSHWGEGYCTQIAVRLLCVMPCKCTHTCTVYTHATSATLTAMYILHTV